MLRFDQLVRQSMTVGEVKERYPKSVLVFEQFGFRGACDHCAIEQVARRQGLSPMDVVDALNLAIFKTEEPASPELECVCCGKSPTGAISHSESAGNTLSWSGFSWRRVLDAIHHRA